MSLQDILEKRHSVRRYTEEKIPDEAIRQILNAGLLSPSSRSIRPWEFIVVRDPEMLAYLSKCRAGGAAAMLEGADGAIIVIADPEKSDVWIEDCSIALSNMHIMASSLGIGSCWIQGRLRNATDDVKTEDYLRERLAFPKSYRLEAILSLGMPASAHDPHAPGTVPTEKIHWEKY